MPFLPPTIIGKRRRVSFSGSVEEELLEDLPPLKDLTTVPPAQVAASPLKQPSRSSNSSKQASSSSKTSALYTVTENERVVHELLLYGDEALRTLDPADDSSIATQDPMVTMSRDVQRVAERAFWDALEEGLRVSPPQWERLVVLLGEAREALADIIPEASQEGRHLRSSLAEKLDLDYIRTRLQAGYDPEYLQQLFDFIVYIISSLEAPARSESTKKGYAEVMSTFAATIQQQPGKERRVRVSMETTRSTQVPVSLVAREAWLPVDFASSPKRAEAPRGLTHASPSGASDGSAEDWVVAMHSADDHPGTVGSTRSASPAVMVGAPVESEEVEVRFGIPVDRDAVTVQLLASPSRSATPQPPMPLETVAAAPAQQPSADEAGRAAALAGAARFVFDKIAELRADLAKARLEMLKGILQGSSSGIQFEQRRLTDAVGDRDPGEALPNTCAWLQGGFTKVAPAQAKVAETSALRAIVAESLLALIQRPAAIAPRECPETLLLDVQRLVAAQNELQRLSLVGASLLVAQMLLGTKGLPPSPAITQNREYYAEVKEAFAALLAKADVRMPHLTAAMADLLARRLAGGDAAAKPTAADTETVNRMLMRIFSVDDVIYKKVQQGVVEALRAQLIGPAQDRDREVAAKLRTVGAELIQAQACWTACCPSTWQLPHHSMHPSSEACGHRAQCC
ncbi:probable T-complex protein 11-like protein 2 at N-terminal half [Coccomyxa sp. Obi]|nr:probable T-complex protein 11-like protein 2 at N-terminal half [Coccomyxa sp. Obi]